MNCSPIRICILHLYCTPLQIKTYIHCDYSDAVLILVFRCRHGYFHVVNNDYTHWEMYAIGGSASPTINSQGNRFLAPNDRFNKEVKKPHNKINICKIGNTIYQNVYPQNSEVFSVNLKL